MFSDTRPHYICLDALRGVAAILVVWYHIQEGFAFASGGMIEDFNHGHLCVDFFFMLSGFVLSYAYDSRWSSSSSHRLTLGRFFLRRLIRLHPMLVLGTTIGLASFIIGGAKNWDGSIATPAAICTAYLLGLLLFPMYPSAWCDVRGNGEMYPLNGPSWSLFFEYIGNILYALWLRRSSNRAMAVVAFIVGVLWLAYAAFDFSTYGMLGVGWTADSANIIGGLLRMLFPFTTGMLIARHYKPRRVPFAFLFVVVALLVLFSVPYLPNLEGLSLNVNCIYEFACVAFVFPVLVWAGASGTTGGVRGTHLCNLLGRISYPLYLVHYPIMYLFYQWMIDTGCRTLEKTWPIASLAIAASLVLAYAALRLWDEPIRKKLLNWLLLRPKTHS